MTQKFTFLIELHVPTTSWVISSQRPPGVLYLVQLLLHAGDYHNDGHEGAEEEEEGEEEAGDGGVLGGGAAAAEQARGRAAETRHLQGDQPVLRGRNGPQNTCPGQSLRRSHWESTPFLRATHTTAHRTSRKQHQIPPKKVAENQKSHRNSQCGKCH